MERVKQGFLVCSLIISVLHLVEATQYKVYVYTGYGATSDVFSVKLRGAQGTTGEHVLRPSGGSFTYGTIKRFTITDKDVGKVIAVEAYLRLVGSYKYTWQLLKIIVWSSSTRKYYIFLNKVNRGVMKHDEWITISPDCPKGFEKGVHAQCVDVNECAKPGACADPLARCQNTIGSFQCACPKGYYKDRHGKCKDIYECRYNPPCEGWCVNTPGSFHCQCWQGYRVVRRYYCQDINECQETPHVCTDKQRCHNFRGGYRCENLTCHRFSDYVPSNGQLVPPRCYKQGGNWHGDKCTLICNHGYLPVRPGITTTTCQKNKRWTTVDLMQCVAQQCPPLAEPSNGYVTSKECATVGSSYNSYPCHYYCNSGYKRLGNQTLTCQADGTWSGTTPRCILVPIITCPRDILVTLKPGRNTTDITDRWTVSSNVKTVIISPQGVNSRYQFPYGVTVVTFKAINELGEADAAVCRMRVDVKDTEPPKKEFCPPKYVFKFSLTFPVTVTFGKPQFTDNVGVTRLRPAPFGSVTHTGPRTTHFGFDAWDASGNHVKCEFFVVTGGDKCDVLPEAPPRAIIRKMSYGGNIYMIVQCMAGYAFHMSSDSKYLINYYICNKTTGVWSFTTDKSYTKLPYCVDFTSVNGSQPCPPGAIKRTAKCAKCPPGSHYLNSTTCQECSAGFYQDKQGKLACIKCPAGTSSHAGAKQCRAICKPGTFSKDGLGPFCKLCPASTYQHEHGKTGCNRCPDGTHTLTEGASFCGNGPRITSVEAAWSANKQDVTLKCYAQGIPSPSVYWSGPGNPPVSKQTQILDKKGKPVGTQLHLKMAASRALPQTYKCTAGNPVDIVYKDLVVQAPQKSKRDLTEYLTGLNEDEFLPQLDAQVKVPCPPGYYSDTGLGPICKICLRNTYQDLPNQRRCLPCAKGTFTTQLGASTCGAAAKITGTNSSSLTIIDHQSKDIVMDCYATGRPAPYVHWTMKEQVPAAFRGAFKQEQLFDKLGRPVGTRLTIRDVTSHNRGTYECEAANIHGRETRGITLVWK